MRAVLPAIARPLLAPHLPADLDVTWFATPAEAAAGIATAEIAWVDMQPPALTGTAVAAAVTVAAAAVVIDPTPG